MGNTALSAVSHVENPFSGDSLPPEETDSAEVAKSIPAVEAAAMEWSSFEVYDPFVSFGDLDPHYADLVHREHSGVPLSRDAQTTLATLRKEHRSLFLKASSGETLSDEELSRFFSLQLSSFSAINPPLQDEFSFSEEMVSLLRGTSSYTFEQFGRVWVRQRFAVAQLRNSLLQYIRQRPDASKEALYEVVRPYEMLWGFDSDMRSAIDLLLQRFVRYRLNSHSLMGSHTPEELARELFGSDFPSDALVSIKCGAFSLDFELSSPGDFTNGSYASCKVTTLFGRPVVCVVLPRGAPRAMVSHEYMHAEFSLYFDTISPETPRDMNSLVSDLEGASTDVSEIFSRALDLASFHAQDELRAFLVMGDTAFSKGIDALLDLDSRLYNFFAPLEDALSARPLYLELFAKFRQRYIGLINDAASAVASLRNHGYSLQMVAGLLVGVPLTSWRSVARWIVRWGPHSEGVS